jgi:serine/threonine protein phosphatase PrpC
VSGDAVFTLEAGDHLLLALVDGTGHGRPAHEIAARISNVIDRHAGESDLVRLMQRLHVELQGTLGAAVGLADVDLTSRSFHYLGVGNIRASKLGLRPWRGLSKDGVLGTRLPTPYLQQERLDAGDLLVLWTDGMPELDCIKRAAAISFRSAADIAAKLVDTLGKTHDDVGCLTLKWQP